VGLPMLWALGTDSGLSDFTHRYVSNPGAFQWIDYLAIRLVTQTPLRGDSRVAARWIMLGLLTVAAVWIGLRPVRRGEQLVARIALVILLMLLLSPMVWPWYYLSVLAVCAAAPRPSLLIWTMLLPICYLPLGTAKDRVVGLAVHVPVWVLLIVEWGVGLWGRRRREPGD